MKRHTLPHIQKEIEEIDKEIEKLQRQRIKPKLIESLKIRRKRLLQRE